MMMMIVNDDNNDFEMDKSLQSFKLIYINNDDDYDVVWNKQTQYCEKKTTKKNGFVYLIFISTYDDD